MSPTRTLGLLGLTLAMALSPAGCASTPSQGSQAPTSSSGSSLTGDGPWTLNFVDDRCALTGAGPLASTARCELLGELQLTGAQASSMGQKAAALTPRGEETDGGSLATLSTHAAEYRLDSTQWVPLLAELKSALTTARTAEREARFAGAPSCPAGQVLLDFNSCPGNGTVADVCGAPAVSCGAPIATGGACLHDGACASKKCGFLSAVCEP